VICEAGKRWIFSSGKARGGAVSGYGNDEQHRQRKKDALYRFRNQDDYLLGKDV